MLGTACRHAIGSLRIVGARLIDDGRTLVLATDPHPRVALATRSSRSAPTRRSLRPDGRRGRLERARRPADGPNWSGWWPQLDLEATRRLDPRLEAARGGLALLSRPGRLTPEHAHPPARGQGDAPDRLVRADRGGHARRRPGGGVVPGLQGRHSSRRVDRGIQGRAALLHDDRADRGRTHGRSRSRRPTGPRAETADRPIDARSA